VSRSIEVFADAEVTFKAERIRDGYKRSLSFTTSKGVEEEWIYRSHGSSIYFILSRTFDIKAIETVCKADDEDVDNFTFTASDYPPKLMTNLVEVMDNLEVDARARLTISPSHHLHTRPPHHLTVSPSAHARLTIPGRRRF